MPRGMIAAPPMPQYGMPMNGQMPPPPPMMPPMPPMPPQPQQQGAQSQPQSDPWAGGINPSLTALLPQQGAAPSYTPPPYSPPPPVSWMQPAPAAPAPTVEVQPAQSPSAPPSQSTPSDPPASPSVKPTPIVPPGWAWPLATVGVPIEPGALDGVRAKTGQNAPPAELQELIPAESTLHPWRRPAAATPERVAPPFDPWRPAPAFADHPLNPWRQAARVPPEGARPEPPPPRAPRPATLPDYWPKPVAVPPQAGSAPERPADLPRTAPPAPTQIVQPSASQPAEPEPTAGTLQAAEAGLEPDPIPYYPTLAPAVPIPPVQPMQPNRPPSTGDGTYSTREARYARKIL